MGNSKLLATDFLKLIAKIIIFHKQRIIKYPFISEYVGICHFLTNIHTNVIVFMYICA